MTDITAHWTEWEKWRETRWGAKVSPNTPRLHRQQYLIWFSETAFKPWDYLALLPPQQSKRNKLVWQCSENIHAGDTSENEDHLTSRPCKLTIHQVSQACVSHSWTIVTATDHQGELFWETVEPRNLQVAPVSHKTMLLALLIQRGQSGASRDYYYQDLWAEWLSYAFTLYTVFKT